MSLYSPVEVLSLLSHTLQGMAMTVPASLSLGEAVSHGTYSLAWSAEFLMLPLWGLLMFSVGYSSSVKSRVGRGLWLCEGVFANWEVKLCLSLYQRGFFSPPLKLLIKSLLMSKGKSKLKNLSDYRLTEKKMQDDEIQVFFFVSIRKIVWSMSAPLVLLIMLFVCIRRIWNLLWK